MHKHNASENELAISDTKLARGAAEPEPDRDWLFWFLGTALIAYLATHYPDLAALWLALADRMPHP